MITRVVFDQVRAIYPSARLTDTDSYIIAKCPLNPEHRIFFGRYGPGPVCEGGCALEEVEAAQERQNERARRTAREMNGQENGPQQEEPEWLKAPSQGDAEPSGEARRQDPIKSALLAGWHNLTPEDLRNDPPPQAFVWKPRIPAGQVTVLSGPGGSTKTTLLTNVAVCRALGLSFLDGTQPTEGETVILSTEDRLEDYRRKLAALRVELGADFNAERVAARVHFVDLSGVPIRMVAAEYGQYKPTSLPDLLAEVILERAPKADLIVLETVSRLAGGAETNESLSILVEAAQRLCKLTGAAVVLVHHVSQDAGRRGVADQYAGRGGSALSDNARSSLVLTHLTADNLKQYAPGATPSPQEMERLLVFAQPKSNGAKGAPALLLERHGNDHGPVLRLASLQRHRTESEAERIERLRGVVERLTGRGVAVSRTTLRDYTQDVGVSKDDLGKLVTEALAARALTETKRPGRGGGMQLLPAARQPIPERPDWRPDP